MMNTIIISKAVTPCKHHVTVVTGFISWYTYADVQYSKGIKQDQCPICLLWFFPDEMGKQK